MPRAPHDAPPRPSPAPAVPVGSPGSWRRPPGPSAKPALIPIGIAALVLIGGGIGAVLTTSSGAPPATKAGFPTAAGAGLHAVSAATALRPIVTGGEPPADVTGAVALPGDAAAVAGSAVNQTTGLYDHSLSFTAPVSEEQLISFYRAELRAEKWQIESQGPPPHGAAGYRLVAEHPGSDGYEWQLGVTVSPTTFGSGPTAASDTTSFTLRLFAASDD